MRRLLFVLAACGHPHAPPPARPEPTVRDEVRLAEDAERQRRHDVAREHYERAVAGAHDPASVAFARHEYAETLVTWGEVPAAIAQLEAAVAAKPDDAGVWHDLGLARHHEGDDRGAVYALERARTLLPRDPRPRIALAALRWQLGDKPGAAAEYRALLELDLPDRVRTKVEWALGELAKP